jgi:hypothetical protein
MAEETTDNKVETETDDPDAPRMKHEVEEIIEAEEDASTEEVVTTEEEIPPTEEVVSDEETASEELTRLKQEYANLEQRYAGSSEEGKRLADREKFLKERWNSEELFDGYEEQPSAEDKPITRRELQEMQEVQRWQGAEESFFTNPDNKDMTHPIMERTVKAMLFQNDGSIRYPDKSPRESFDLAAKEVRNYLAEQRQLGKQELTTTRTEMEKAAITDATSLGPDAVTEAEEDEIHEDEYARMFRRQQEQQANE